MIEKLFSDTLWIYTALIGSLLGAAFVTYFKDTNLGIWCYAKFDEFLDYLVKRWGLTFFKQRQSYSEWRKEVNERLDNLEKKRSKK